MESALVNRSAREENANNGSCDMIHNPEKIGTRAKLACVTRVWRLAPGPKWGLNHVDQMTVAPAAACQATAAVRPTYKKELRQGQL